ncbi:hypothetical protein [Xanthomarina gelatinilytica]|uniref:hypothetical protein n=1 Tax=Xanthomarina gelatinilytica TaxID=1137281 RepID=UPI003AA7E0E7
MKKNYFSPVITLPNIFIALLFLISFSGFGQSHTKANQFTIKSEFIEIENSQIGEIEIAWDFSVYANRTQTILEIEIQPLNGCWNGLDGTIRSEKVIKPIKDISQNPKGKLYLTFKEYNTKCFKWRVKTMNTTDGNESFTNWQFSSFL